MIFVAIPQIFENMEEATLGRWLVREGQTVSEGAPLCELVTEKTTLELPAPGGGTILHLAAPEKATLPAHFIIALIGQVSEPLPDLASLNPKIEAPLTISVSAPASALVSSTLRATPAARRAAKIAGVALGEVAARFSGKVLSEEDVKAFIAEQ